MAELVFWISIGILFYAYVGYHLLLKLAALLVSVWHSSDSASSGGDCTPVSVVVAVHNEERVIEQRIENLLHLDYPRDKLEIIIASDGSTDRTNAIAQRYRPLGVSLLTLARIGKGPAQDQAVACAKGEIVILTDADTEFEPGFATAVVGHFARHPRVGAVTANLDWKIEAAPTPPARLRELSWKLETDLRETESKLGLLASASGAAMAFRKSLWKPMRDAINDSDSLTPLDVILQGYKVVFAPDAMAHDEPFTSARSDFKAKVRGVSKSVVMIPRRWRLRDWARHPLITWRTASHHLVRWMVPYLMVAAVLSSLFLVRHNAFYRTIVVLEIGVAVAAASGYLATRMRKPLAIASMLFSFVVINAGFAVGLFKGVVGAVQGPFETE